MVALLAIGLLTMHGLTSASSKVEHEGHAGAVQVVVAELGVHGSPDHTTGDGGGHDPLHDIGDACLWLLVGSALFFALRRFGSGAIRRGASTPKPCPFSWVSRSPLHHPPDSALATVVLRC